MPKVTFLLKDGTIKDIDALENWSLMQIALEHGLEGIDGACGGALSCGTCHVYVHPEWTEKVIAANNEQTQEEEDALDQAFDIRETSRLGCQIKVTKALDGLIVAMPGTKTNW